MALVAQVHERYRLRRRLELDGSAALVERIAFSVALRASFSAKSSRRFLCASRFFSMRCCASARAAASAAACWRATPLAAARCCDGRSHQKKRGTKRAICPSKTGGAKRGRTSRTEPRSNQLHDRAQKRNQSPNQKSMQSLQHKNKENTSGFALTAATRRTSDARHPRREETKNKSNQQSKFVDSKFIR